MYTGWIVFYYYSYILQRACGPIIRRILYIYIHGHTGCEAGVCMARGDTGRRTLFMAVVIRNIIKRFLDIRYPDDDGATRNGP